MKTRYKYIAVITLLLMLDTVSHAQQPLNYNLYTLNPFLLNPAYTGANGCLNVFLNNHRQWTNLENAPASYTFGAHTRLKNNVSGIGLVAVSDNRSYVNYTTVNGTYAQVIRLRDQHTLYLGISIGFASNKLNVEKLQVRDPGDPMLQNLNNVRFDAGFGALYAYKRLKAGVSIPHFFDPTGKFSQQWNAMLSQDFFANKKKEWVLTPMLMMRNYQAAGMIYDIQMKGTWKEKVSAQLGYRTDKSVIAGIGLNWGNFQIGYAYQFHTGTLYNAFSPSGTQEIQLAFKLCKLAKLPADVAAKEPEVVKAIEAPAPPPPPMPEPKVTEKDATDVNKELAPPMPAVPAPVEEKPVEIAETYKDKIKFELNLMDELTQKPVEGEVEIKKDELVAYAGKLGANGTTTIYLGPDKYKMKITAKEFLPVIEDLDLTKKEKGSAFQYRSKTNKIQKGLMFKYKNVTFKTASDTLQQQAHEVLDNIGAILLDNPQMVIEVAGYTDNVGDDHKNLVLSQLRARSVARYLEAAGVKPKQLKVVGYGEANPVGLNEFEEGRLMNRRVQFTVLEF